VNVRETLAYVATVVIFVDCINAEPKVGPTQLDADKKRVNGLK